MEDKWKKDLDYEIGQNVWVHNTTPIAYPERVQIREIHIVLSNNGIYAQYQCSNDIVYQSHEIFTNFNKCIQQCNLHNKILDLDIELVKREDQD
jgi:hypothetical protein